MHQALDAREIGLQVFLLHPVVVKVGVAGLGRSDTLSGETGRRCVPPGIDPRSDRQTVWRAEQPE